MSSPMTEKTHDMVPVEVLNANEPWTTLFLENGVKLKIKLVITTVYNTKVKDPKGKDLYSFEHQLVAVAEHPDK